MAYEYRFALGMSSVDRAGVLFYPDLFRHAHDAYEAFMASIGVGLDQVLEEGRYAIPVVHAQADYLQPMAHGGIITVTLRIQKLGDSSFTVGCDFRDSTGNLCARAETVHVVVDRRAGSPCSIPPQWQARLRGTSGEND